METISKTPVSILNEMMAKKAITPVYDLIFDGTGSESPIFKYKVSCDTVTAIGTGRCKKIAKQDAAQAALEKLMFSGKRSHSDSSLETLDKESRFFDQEEVLSQSEKNSQRNSSPPGNINVMQTLQMLCREYAVTPEFTTMSMGPPHAPKFTVCCKVSNFREEGFAATKKLAKREAVCKMIDAIKLMKDLNHNLHQIDYSSSKTSEISNSSAFIPHNDIYVSSLKTSKGSPQQKKATEFKNMPPEIKEQLIIVKNSVEKLLSLI